MQKPKIGVVGGGRGATMVDYLVNFPEKAELVAVCDKYEPAMGWCKELAKQHGMDKVKFLTDFDEFLQLDLDAVVLANYAHQHAPFAVKVLESGRHVMTEVLACATLDEAVRLAEAVEKSGKVYNYAENYCYFPTTAEMRRLYRRGDIGEVMYGEGEYLHDCSSIWPQITYGQREHWRNNLYSTFYCTHALGPLIHITGLRPVKVAGFESRLSKSGLELGIRSASQGIIMVQLENHALLKAAQGLTPKRTPESINYVLYGDNGEFETDRYDGFSMLNTYVENGKNCAGEHKHYNPELIGDAANAGHGGSDYFTMNNFVGSIMGDEEAAKETVGVYEALDMTIPGILAYKSILGGNNAIDMIDIRDKAAREAYRGDTFCSFPDVAGDQLVPPFSGFNPEISDEVYEEVKRKWEQGLPG